MWTLVLEFDEGSKKYLEKFGAKIGQDWNGVVMTALAVAEAIQEGVVEHRKTIVLTGDAYGPLEGIMIGPWDSEDESSKPLARVIAFPAKAK